MLPFTVSSSSSCPPRPRVPDTRRGPNRPRTVTGKSLMMSPFTVDARSSAFTSEGRSRLISPFTVEKETSSPQSALPIEASIEKLRGLRFDLSKSSTATWEGRSVAVVGATAGDTTSAQFWVDPERLVVVRIIQPMANGGRRDTQIGKFSEGGPGLVEREINFFTNGTHDMKEEYIWIKTGVTLDPALFMPGNTATPAWVSEYKKSR